MAGGGGMPSWGLCGFKTKTNAPTIYKQAGMGTQVGGSVSIGASLGVEYNMLIDSESNQTYHGVTGLVGIGASAIPAEFHGEVSNSWILGVNLYDAAIAFVDWLTPNK